jgi:SAM-dependent methyltransferase
VGPIDTANVARVAYAGLAPHYDDYTAHPAYSGWIRRLEALARRHGLRGRRALDVGCGTGKSLLPLLELGYDVTGCEPVAEMLAVAQAKTGARARLVQSDAAGLPPLGTFDYVTCLNDVCNYILDRADLGRSFQAIAANMRAGAILVFDANTEAAYRTHFSGLSSREAGECVFVWRGEGRATFIPGDVACAVLDVFVPDRGLWRRETSRHVQRHHPVAVLVDALTGAGLRLLSVYGQAEDGRPERPLRPRTHEKAICIATRLR